MKRRGNKTQCIELTWLLADIFPSLRMAKRRVSKMTVYSNPASGGIFTNYYNYNRIETGLIMKINAKTLEMNEIKQ
jgi:hypothetical protein